MSIDLRIQYWEEKEKAVTEMLADQYFISDWKWLTVVLSEMKEIIKNLKEKRNPCENGTKDVSNSNTTEEHVEEKKDENKP